MNEEFLEKCRAAWANLPEEYLEALDTVHHLNLALDGVLWMIAHGVTNQNSELLRDLHCAAKGMSEEVWESVYELTSENPEDK